MIYEGLLTRCKEDGKAEVVIQPHSAGIPGATKRINARVCHCATPASTIRIEALNSAGAGVGDRVSISRDNPALMKNWGILLGIPLAGLISGIALAFLFTNSFSFHPFVGAALGIPIALSTVALSQVWYRKVPTDTQPVIDHIIQVGGETGKELCGESFSSINKSSGCDGCL